MGSRPTRVLITGGPTRAYLDDVRFITNHGTGRLGALMAEEAAARGWDVLYLAGRGSVLPRTPGGEGRGAARVTVAEIETVNELAAAVREAVGDKRCDAVIHSMAVLDFAPAGVRPGKVPSSGEWIIRLVPTPKVIRMVKDLDPNVYLVGFKLEAVHDEAALAQAARAALAANRADMVVANGLDSIRRGEHRAVIVAAGADAAEEVVSKEAVARRVVARVAEALQQRGRPEGEGGTP